ATIAGYGAGETIAEIELRRMTCSFAISRKSGESSLRIRGRDWNAFDSCDRKKFLHIGLRFADACMPFSANPRTASKMAIGDVMDTLASSSRSAKRSASNSRPKMATIAEA